MSWFIRSIVAVGRRRDKSGDWVSRGVVGFDRVMNQDMKRIRVVSFDAEGTLASHEFSRSFWQQVVPALYAEQQGMPFDEAAQWVYGEYMSIGPGRREWYDIGYWFQRFGLGIPGPAIEAHRPVIQYYPDVRPVLESLERRFVLVVASSTPYEFLRPLLREVEASFQRVFSSTSDCGRLKDTHYFRWLSGELKAEPHEILHVGDHVERDYQCALAAGMHAFHLDRTGESGTALRSLEELLDLLEH